MANIEITGTSAPADSATPSKRLIAQARARVDVVDELGRTITIGKPQPLDNLDFAKATGGDRVNIDYQLEVGHLKFVRAIDGDEVVCPGSETELRALYAQLGDEGNAAVRAGVVEHIIKAGAAAEQAKNS